MGIRPTNIIPGTVAADTTRIRVMSCDTELIRAGEVVCVVGCTPTGGHLTVRRPSVEDFGKRLLVARYDMNPGSVQVVVDWMLLNRALPAEDIPGLVRGQALDVDHALVCPRWEAKPVEVVAAENVGPMVAEVTLTAKQVRDLAAGAEVVLAELDGEALTHIERISILSGRATKPAFDSGRSLGFKLAGLPMSCPVGGTKAVEVSTPVFSLNRGSIKLEFPADEAATPKGGSNRKLTFRVFYTPETGI